MPSNPHRLAVNATNNRHLEKGADGSPFFPMALTVWELFQRADLTEAQSIVAAAADAEYNVILGVLLDEIEGPDVAASCGYKPFAAHDWTDAEASATAGYWAFVDSVVDEAEAAGVYMGLLPCWGSHVVSNVAYRYFAPQTLGGGSTGRPADAAAAKARAYSYGKFLGERYWDKPILWVLGGDVGSGEDYWTGQNEVWDEMARGIEDGIVEAGGVASEAMITFHPGYANYRSHLLHTRTNANGTAWCKLHASQAAHFRYDEPNAYEHTEDNYALTSPVKPTWEMEYAYYALPRGTSDTDPPSGESDGRFRAYDLRLGFFWSTFNGGCGYGLSTFALWQLYKSGRSATGGTAENEWMTELAASAVTGMKYCRWLFDRLPGAHYFSRAAVPNATLLPSQSSIQQHRKEATGNWDGTKLSWSYVYFPASGWDPVSNSWAGSHSVAIDLTKFDSSKGGVRAWWYNPRTGVATEAVGAGWVASPAPSSGNTYARASTTFTKPNDATDGFAATHSRGNDWVLFLASENETGGIVGDPSYVGGDVTAPTLSSAVADGATLTLTYDEPLDAASEPAAGDYALSGGRSVTAVNVTGSTVELTVSPAFAHGDAGGTLDYTPGASPVQDEAGNDAAALDDQAVTNSTPDTSAPGAPTGLAADPEAATFDVFLTWDAVGDAAEYRVFRDAVLIGSPTLAEFTDNVPPGTYSYTVAAVDAADNEGDPSAALEVTVPEAGGGGGGIVARPVGGSPFIVSLN